MYGEQGIPDVRRAELSHRLRVLIRKVERVTPETFSLNDKRSTMTFAFGFGGDDIADEDAEV